MVEKKKSPKPGRRSTADWRRLIDKRLKMDGIKLLAKLPDDTIALAFFDPQYRGLLDQQRYGNEGKGREKRRCALPQMNEDIIRQLIAEIARTLRPSGHLMMWIDKFHLCTGVEKWICDSGLEIVDLVTWHKGKIGMGYRTRRASEHLMIMQKPPKRAKGVWKKHNIPDVLEEKADASAHPHAKPIGLQQQLIEAVTDLEDIVVDPAAGSFSVMEACHKAGRKFVGCDLMK